MTASLAAPMAAAAAALRDRQHADGRWEDFELPVGRSTAWVTAYVALALGDHAALAGDDEAAGAVARAARWLATHRGDQPGWGYHRRAGADSDSTAHALMVLRRQREDCAQPAVWLRNGWLPTGGFPTYRRADAWGVAHPCVTPVAYLALDDDDRQTLREPFVAYALAQRDPDGAWRAYWWQTRCYSTFVNLLALRAAGVAVDDRGLAALAAGCGDSPFDLACVTAAAAVCGSPVLAELVDRLLARALPGGGFPPGACLRVTDPDCYRPWERPAGRVYVDVDGIFTTATALRALALAAEAAG